MRGPRVGCVKTEPAQVHVDSLVLATFSAMADIRILPRRLSLETPRVKASVPMMRGVWGAALHDLDPRAYDQVFASDPPRYILRPAPPDPANAPALDWILPAADPGNDDALLSAWRKAAVCGLGPDRVPFKLRSVDPLGPDGGLVKDEIAVGWRLTEARWPIGGDPPVTPCRIVFPAPLRILRRKQLVVEPTLVDLIIAAVRRLSAYAQDPMTVRSLAGTAKELAAATPQGKWSGRRTDLVRWSGNQKAEIELRGIIGAIELPRGPGSLWPLLLAATWLHLGKGTVFGLGQPTIERL